MALHESIGKRILKILAALFKLPEQQEDTKELKKQLDKLSEEVSDLKRTTHHHDLRFDFLAREIEITRQALQFIYMLQGLQPGQGVKFRNLYNECQNELLPEVEELKSIAKDSIDLEHYQRLVYLGGRVRNNLTRTEKRVCSEEPN